MSMLLKEIENLPKYLKEIASRYDSVVLISGPNYKYTLSGNFVTYSEEKTDPIDEERITSFESFRYSAFIERLSVPQLMAVAEKLKELGI